MYQLFLPCRYVERNSSYNTNTKNLSSRRAIFSPVSLPFLVYLMENVSDISVEKSKQLTQALNLPLNSRIFSHLNLPISPPFFSLHLNSPKHLPLTMGVMLPWFHPPSKTPNKLSQYINHLLNNSSFPFLCLMFPVSHGKFLF